MVGPHQRSLVEPFPDLKEMTFRFSEMSTSATTGIWGRWPSIDLMTACSSEEQARMSMHKVTGRLWAARRQDGTVDEPRTLEMLTLLHAVCC